MSDHQEASNLMLVACLRDCFNRLLTQDSWEQPHVDKGHAALDALARRLADLERERQAMLDASFAIEAAQEAEAASWVERWDVMMQRAVAAEAREMTLREALRAIQANAEAWHGPPEDEPRRAAALGVIARWAQDPSTIPDGVREHARAALAPPGQEAKPEVCEHCHGDGEEPHTDCDWGPIVPCSKCGGRARSLSGADGGGEQ